MTNRDTKNLITIICCCLSVVLSLSILTSCLDNSDEQNGDSFTQLTYVALGDSITYGYDWSRNGQAMDNPYVKLVGEKLKLKNAVNHGVSAATICTDVDDWRVEMCVHYKSMRDDADIVSVMGGVNDFSCRVPLGNLNDTDTTTFYGALNTLAQGLKSKYPNAFIFFMTPLKVQNIEGKVNNGSTLDDFRNAIKNVCDKYGIAVLDTAVLADFSQEYNADGYEGDGLHPSQAFVRNTLAPVIAQFIRDNYKK